MDLHPVSCSTFVHSSRSLFVLGNLDNMDKSHFVEIYIKGETDFWQPCNLFDFYWGWKCKHITARKRSEEEYGPTYCAGSELHWSLVDTCRRNQWRCRPCRSHWPHMFLCCGKGSGGKGLWGKRVEHRWGICFAPQLRRKMAASFTCWCTVHTIKEGSR